MVWLFTVMVVSAGSGVVMPGPAVLPRPSISNVNSSVSRQSRSCRSFLTLSVMLVLRFTSAAL